MVLTLDRGEKGKLEVTVAKGLREPIKAFKQVRKPTDPSQGIHKHYKSIMDCNSISVTNNSNSEIHIHNHVHMQPNSSPTPQETQSQDSQSFNRIVNNSSSRSCLEPITEFRVLKTACMTCSAKLDLKLDLLSLKHDSPVNKFRGHHPLKEVNLHDSFPILQAKFARLYLHAFINMLNKHKHKSLLTPLMHHLHPKSRKRTATT